jgi:ubiquinone/menaquinone biosynthesis C-methylase UbiE
MDWLNIEGYKKWWGRMVFRYAGRNISAQNPKSSRTFYNSIGWLYDALYGKGIANYQKAADYVCEQYIQPGDRILDIGCGTGLFIEKVMPKSSQVVGLDLSFGMLKKAQDKFESQPNTLFINADCRQLPIRGEFDKIFSGFMLVILPRIERFKAIKNMHHLLRSGGEAIFLTSRESLSEEWLTTEEWIYYCEGAGFHGVVIDDILDYYRIVRAQKP